MLPLLVQLIMAPVSPSAASPGLPSATDHQDEIAAYGEIMGVTITASKLCADILVNENMIVELKRYFHLAKADLPAIKIAFEAKQHAMERAAAPNQQAWCDEAYRAYGPNGDTIPRLMSR